MEHSVLKNGFNTRHQTGEAGTGSGDPLNSDPGEHYKDVKVAERYDSVRFSSMPGRIFNALEQRCVRKAFSRIPPNSLILDAPCGTGRLAEVLLDVGHRVVGVDISPAMITVAKRKLARFGSRFQTRVKDVRDFLLEEEQFDAALSARVLMHFPLEQQISFLRSVVHVTRGTVVFNQSIDSRYNTVRRGIKKRLGHQTPVAFPISMADAQTLVREAGLTLDKRILVLPFVSEAAFFICH